MASHLHDDELIALASGEGDRPHHLSQCGQCESRLRQYEQTLQLSASRPDLEWNNLQAGAFVHRVRYGIDQRRSAAAVGWWRPAMAGMGVAMVMMLVIQSLFDDREQSSPTSPTVVAQAIDYSDDVEAGLRTDELPNYAGSRADDVADWSEVEVYSMIDAYLVETASDDELLTTLGDMTDEDLYALLDE